MLDIGQRKGSGNADEEETIDIKTFEELTQVDERVRVFASPRLVNGSITIAQHDLESAQRMIADCDLVSSIPEHVRDQFETCRKLHTYGCFAYEFFTVATERAYFVVEAALGAKFVEHYAHGIPMEDESGRRELLEVTSFRAVDAALRHGGRYPYKGNRKKGWIVQGHTGFNGSMRALTRWAHQEGLLGGQRNRVVLSAIHQLRNLAAHPHDPLVLPPSNSARTIRDVAEIVNHLWGHDTPGGRLYGTPLEMGLLAIRWRGNGSRMVCGTERLVALPVEDRNGLWFLIEAASHDEGLSWEPYYKTTAYPTTLIWTGTSWQDAVAEAQRYQASGRRPEPRAWRDRHFLVRRGPAGYEAPRSLEQFLSLPSEERDVPDTTWCIVCADHPGHVADAWRDPATVAAFFWGLDKDELFRARIDLEEATWEEAAARLAELERPG